MDKTLSAIMTFNKIGKILSKIVFIALIVAAVILAMAIAFLPIGFEDFVYEVGGVSINGFIADTTDLTTTELYFGLGVGLFYCIATGVLAKFSLSYFSKVLKAGTPFTLESSKEILRLGIFMLVIPFVVSVTVSAVCMYVPEIQPLIDEWNMEIFNPVCGILFIFLSFVYKYVAEKEAKLKKR